MSSPPPSSPVPIAQVATLNFSSPPPSSSSPPPLSPPLLSSVDLFNRLSGFGSLMVIDCRPHAAYMASHLPRSLNVDLDEMQLPYGDAALSAQLDEELRLPHGDE